MSENQQDPKIAELSKKIESLEAEKKQMHADFEEKSKKIHEETQLELKAQDEKFQEKWKQRSEEHDAEVAKLKEEMKKIAASKGVKVQTNPKGCYSDSKTRRAKLAADEAKKSKSKTE